MTVDPARATVGALLLLPSADRAVLLDAVRDDDPDEPRLRIVLGLVRQVHDLGLDPDPVAVLAHARSSGTLRAGELHGLSVLLSELVSVDCCPLPLAAGGYAVAVVESAIRRRVLAAAVRMTEAADSGSVEALVDVVHAELVDLVAALDRLDRPVVLGGAR